MAPNATAWSNERVPGIGARKDLGEGTGEVKSMRTHPQVLRQGVAAALLEQIISAARQRGMSRLRLETGSGPALEPAIALYRKRGFIDGEAFSNYVRSEFNQFLHLTLRPPSFHQRPGFRTVASRPGSQNRARLRRCSQSNPLLGWDHCPPRSPAYLPRPSSYGINKHLIVLAKITTHTIIMSPVEC